VPQHTIRTARSADFDALAALFRKSSLSNDRDRPMLLANPDALLFEESAVPEQRTRVAVVAERIVGFATTRTVAGIVELDDLFVDPDWMRCGVGRALIGDVVASARAEGAARVEVTANGHALAFYEKVGFVSDTVTETRFGPGLRMHLDVALPISEPYSKAGSLPRTPR
jgi:ribosomal protein S18 acetylase RimI-like enzyme